MGEAGAGEKACSGKHLLRLGRLLLRGGGLGCGIGCCFEVGDGWRGGGFDLKKLAWANIWHRWLGELCDRLQKLARANIWRGCPKLARANIGGFGCVSANCPSLEATGELPALD